MISNVGFGRWSGASSFRDCINYGLRQASGRAPVAQWFEGVSSMETAAFEMEAVASQNVCVDPVYHLIVSWGPEERPSLGRVRHTVDRMRDAIDLGGLQHVCMIHDDGAGEMLHVHDFSNRVDPLTLRARSVWQDEVKLREVCREIELDDGWRVVGNENVNHPGDAWGSIGSKNAESKSAKFVTVIGKRAEIGVEAQSDARSEARVNDVRSPEEAARKPGASSNARDVYGMRKQFRDFVAEEIRPRLLGLLADSKSTWDSVQTYLAGHLLRYEVVSDVGARLAGAVSGFVVSLSEIGLRHREFVERLGDWIGPIAPRRFTRDALLLDRVDQCRSFIEGMSDGAGWAGVHESLGKLDLGIEKRLNGIRIVDLDGPGWIRINRDDPVLSMKALRERFGPYEGGRGEVHRDGVRQAIREAHEAIVERDLIADPSAVLTTVLQSKSAVSFQEVRDDVFRRVTSDGPRERVTRAVLERMTAVSFGRETLLSTVAVREEERRAGEAARALASRRLGRDISALPSEKFSDAQLRAYRGCVGGFGRLKVVTGLSGSEKTDLVETVATAYRAQGYRVRAVAVSRAGVAELRDRTSVPTRSIAREVRSLTASRAAGHAPLEPRDVVIVDQASLVGSEYGSALLRAAEAGNAVVIALAGAGEGRPVARGDALRIMVRGVGEHAVDVSPKPIYRSAWRSNAVEALDRGRVKSALQLCLDAGVFKEHLTKSQAIEAAIAQWGSFEQRGLETTISVDSDLDRRVVAAAARERYREIGRLTGPDSVVQTMDGPTSMAIGDRLIVREPIESSTPIGDGEVVVVAGMKGSVLRLVRRDGARFEIDATSRPGFQYAYASAEQIKQPDSVGFAEIALLSKDFDQVRVAAGIRRGLSEFGAHYSREEHKRGFMSVVHRAERSDKHVLVLDGLERGAGDIVFGDRLEHEIAKERRRGRELGVEIVR